MRLVAELVATLEEAVTKFPSTTVRERWTDAKGD